LRGRTESLSDFRWSIGSRSGICFDAHGWPPK
jgi:hypothetical protein